jgi:uncharacterized protein involved in response to NO
LLEQGFRPLFLGAALFAAIALPAWIALFRGSLELPTHLAAVDWHAHEMIFGYFGAVLGGFILTAVPNWTSRLPVRGGPLAALAGLWLAGRIAVATSAGWPVPAAVVDCLYLATLAAVVGREIVASRSGKNLPVCVLIALVALANIGFHLAVFLDGDVTIFSRMALAIAAMLITLIGGRIVPSFTRNWLVKQGIAPLPEPFGTYDRLVLAATAAALALWIAVPATPATGVSLAVIAALQAARIARWRFWDTLREPLVAILHIGVLWVVVWLALQAISIIAPETLDGSSAVHALTAGAIGAMTLAVMTRAILGHTGRALTADAVTVTIYVLVNAGALARIAVPLFTTDRVTLLTVSGALWAAAFILFAGIYGPIVMRPRADRT